MYIYTNKFVLSKHNLTIQNDAALIRSVVDQVEVDDAEIRIHGRKTVLERLVMGGEATRPEYPVFFVSGAPDSVLRTSLLMRKWEK